MYSAGDRGIDIIFYDLRVCVCVCAVFFYARDWWEEQRKNKTSKILCV